MASNGKLVRKHKKYLVSKLKDGGRRFTTRSSDTKGDVLLASETVGIKVSSDVFLLYRNPYGDGSLMRFTINTTLNPDNNQDDTFILPFPDSILYYDLKILWGDGSESLLSSGTTLTKEVCSHQYETPGEYEISIISQYKTIPGFSFQNNPDNNNVYKLVSVNTPIIKLDPSVSTNGFNKSFMGATNLSSLNGELFVFNNTVSDFSFCFKDCTSLESIPNSLFYHIMVPATYESCFEGDTSLKSIPSYIFLYTSPTSLKRFMYGCTSINSTLIMSSMFGSNYTKLTDVKEMFYNCSGITGDANSFVAWVEKGLNLTYGDINTDQYKQNSLRNCYKMINYVFVDNIYTGQLDELNYLKVGELDWLVVSPEDVLKLY